MFVLPLVVGGNGNNNNNTTTNNNTEQKMIISVQLKLANVETEIQICIKMLSAIKQRVLVNKCSTATKVL